MAQNKSSLLQAVGAAFAAFFSVDRARAELQRPAAPQRQTLEYIPPPPAPVQTVRAPEPKAREKTMLGLGVGLTAVLALFSLVPLEESGRKVEASVENNQVVVKHVSGPEHRTAYRDIVGVLTICDGDTYDVRPGQRATREECTQRLERQLVAHTEPVLKCVPGLKTRDNQLVAAVSLAYNIGTSGFCRSTVARRFNAGQWRQGCDAFLMWNKAGGREVRGLTLRRQRERAICLRGL